MELKIQDTNIPTAVKQLSAIAHEGRLILLRLLIQAGPQGLSASTIANRAKTKFPTASAQLLVLSNAQLVNSTRNGRQVIYRADFTTLTELLRFLTLDCCGSNHQICAALAPELAAEPPGLIDNSCEPP